MTRILDSGERLWRHESEPGPDASYSCIRHHEAGGFVIVGHDGHGIVVVKLDEDGREVWERTIQEPGHVVYPRRLESAQEGGFWMVGAVDHSGETFPFSSSSPFVARLTGDGTLRWSRRVGEIGDEVGSLVESDSGQILALGFVESARGRRKGAGLVYAVDAEGRALSRQLRDIGGGLCTQDAVRCGPNRMLVVGSHTDGERGGLYLGEWHLEQE